MWRILPPLFIQMRKDTDEYGLMTDDKIIKFLRTYIKLTSNFVEAIWRFIVILYIAESTVSIIKTFYKICIPRDFLSSTTG